MKRVLVTIALFIMINASAKAQAKPVETKPVQDTTYQLNFTKQEYIDFITKINLSVDSKSNTDVIFTFVKNAYKVVIADKPKEIIKK